MLAVALLAGCAPDPAPAPPRTTSTASASPTASATATPTPSATPVALPTDCRAILDDAVLAQLENVPLNDPAFPDTGARPGGGLVCVWGDPADPSSRLTTTITSISRGPALDRLNEFAADGYTCYTPDGGTRCEKVWVDEQYPVNDGRTLFWRQDVLVDTEYVGLAPSGYTAAVIASVFG